MVRREGRGHLQTSFDHLNQGFLSSNAVIEAKRNIREALPSFRISQIGYELDHHLRYGDHTPVVIVSETGSGKSISLPLRAYLLGHDKIDCYVPTRRAAAMVASRMAEITGASLGGLVGYRAGKERILTTEADIKEGGGAWHEPSPIIVSTYGTRAYLELFGKESFGERIVFADEIHYFGEEKSFALAGLRKQLDNGDPLKLVIMSATCSAEKISKLFDDCPILEFGGTEKNIERVYMTHGVDEEIANHIRAGRNVLIYEAGRSDCENGRKRVAELLGDKVNETNLFTFYSELPGNQKENFKAQVWKGQFAVWATNALQDSITLPVDVVVNRGEVKRSSIVDGVYTLQKEPTSISEDEQREGRLARVEGRKAIYIYTGERENKSLFVESDLQRGSALLCFIKMKAANIPLEDAGRYFLEPPSDEQFEEAKQLADEIDALAPSGNLSPIGWTLSRAPLEPSAALLLCYIRVELEQLSLQPEQEKEIINNGVILAALLEHSGIYRGSRSGRFEIQISENQSNLLAELELFHKVKDLPKFSLEDIGISESSLVRVKGSIEDVERDLKLDAVESSPLTPTARDLFLRAIYRSKGLNLRLLERSNDSWCEGRGSIPRRLDFQSLIVEPRDKHELAIGLPFNSDSKHLVKLATFYSKEDIQERAKSRKETLTDLSLIRDPFEPVLVATDTVGKKGIRIGEDRVESDLFQQKTEIALWLAQATTSPTTAGPWGLSKVLSENLRNGYTDTIKLVGEYGRKLDQISSWENLLREPDLLVLPPKPSSSGIFSELSDDEVKSAITTLRAGSSIEKERVCRSLLEPLNLREANDFASYDMPDLVRRIASNRYELGSLLFYVMTEFLDFKHPLGGIRAYEAAASLDLSNLEAVERFGARVSKITPKQIQKGLRENGGEPEPGEAKKIISALQKKAIGILCRALDEKFGLSIEQFSGREPIPELREMKDIQWALEYFLALAGKQLREYMDSAPPLERLALARQVPPAVSLYFQFCGGEIEIRESSISTKLPDVNLKTKGYKLHYALLYLAISYAKTGQKLLAEEAFQRLFEIAPKDTIFLDAYNKLVRGYTPKNKDKEKESEGKNKGNRNRGGPRSKRRRRRPPRS